jgi:hypothetical protein
MKPGLVNQLQDLDVTPHVTQYTGQRRTRFRGCDRVGRMFQPGAAAYNLVRLKNLCPQLG